MMKTPGPIVQVALSWIGAATNCFMTLVERLASPQVVAFGENKHSDLVLQKGAEHLGQLGSNLNIPIVNESIDFNAVPGLTTQLQHKNVELTLQSHRFIFLPIELPSRAADFLEGLVRAQIDRLTPWTPNEAAFGWGSPTKKDEHHIVVNLAATAQAFIRPYLDAIASAGACSITVFASPPAALSDGMPIKVWQEKAQGPLSFARIHQILIGTLSVAAVACGVSIGAAAIVAAQYETQREELELKISSLQSKAKAAAHSPVTTGLADARKDLAQRKNASLPSVVVLEALSQILPEQTYVTEFRIEGTKLRLVGVTSDAPALIALLEESHFFSHASFFAPTTRSSSQTAERFHIEATIEPLDSARS
jgi:general secretion pathway protein L